MLLEPLARSEEVNDAIVHLLQECDELPLAHFSPVLNFVLKLQDRPFFPMLLDVTLRDLIRGYLEGNISSVSAELLLQSVPAEGWFRSIAYNELRVLLTYNVWNRSNNWLNAWHILFIAPTALYERDPSLLPDVIDSLLRAYNTAWSVTVARAWTDIIRRCRRECPSSSARLAIATRALRYAVDNTRLPLSEVVTESFLDVYVAVTSAEDTSPAIFNLFGIFGTDWDKGKEMRKSLVNAFLESKWPPGDLALAASDPALFRKIFKRVHRKQGGERYLRAALADPAKSLIGPTPNA